MKDTEFVKRWAASPGSERKVSQTHFRDICELLGEPYPHQDPGQDDIYCFEKGAEKSGGGDGFADVWLNEHFGWEYKGKRKDLRAAYKQLVDYHENLNSPPLLVVCDIDRYEVHTKWMNQESWVWSFRNEDITSREPVAVFNSAGARIAEPPRMSAIEVLRALWEEPDRLRPLRTTEQITKEAAELFDGIAETLRKYGVEHMRVARFISRVVFCMFATDVGLLPAETFSALLKNYAHDAATFRGQLSELFRLMREGGHSGAYPVKHFNGELFIDDDVPEWITADEIIKLGKLDGLNWADVEPAIFGTLFERVLDKTEQRARLGAHYTSREDIELLVEPVLMWPFWRKWEAIKERTDELRARTEAGRMAEVKKLVGPLLEELATVKVLDPACGSGNFLYVSLALLKALEKEVLAFAGMFGVHLEPRVQPGQLYGIELNPYAHELASIVIWIGYLQWKHRNALPLDDDPPILRKLDQIEHKDAILDLSDPANPKEATWPTADVVVGNPPFLGGKRLRNGSKDSPGLGDAYVDVLFAVWDGRVRREADLCVYWHEKARAAIESKVLARAGLIATQSIRNGASRVTLDRIKKSGDIFFAESDSPWVLDGAAVRISMVAQDDGSETRHVLNGKPVSAINPDLTGRSDLTQAGRLTENKGISFMGTTKVGPFELTGADARSLLAKPNPDGRSNSDVVRPWINGGDITGRPRGLWIIDFPTETTERDAALYEAPFEYVARSVRPPRAKNNRQLYRERWWIHAEPRPEFRLRLRGLGRYVCTPRVAEHRVFCWADAATLPDSRIYAFVRDDDYFFGALHSRVHEVWALARGSVHGDGKRGGRPVYNNTTCFETFPMPWPPGQEPAGDPRVIAIGEAAKRLNELREGWLNPKEDIGESELKKRTLTNLYNESPQWLKNAHRTLDEAVFAAYGWPSSLTDEEILERLLAENLRRAGRGAP